MMNVMLLSSGLSDNIWEEVVLSACFILNQVHHRKLDKTPYERWKGYAPNLTYLMVCRCLAKVSYHTFKKPTIESKTFDNVFIGYTQNSVEYRFIYLNDKSICEYRDAKYF